MSDMQYVKDMRKVVTRLCKQMQECVDQTGYAPSMMDYECYMESEEFKEFLEHKCSEDFVVTVEDVFAFMLEECC